ncbi:acetylglutamate kinase [Enterobacter asburiae]|uniref:Acetylglutamate kinase n=1 Tax=Enterobacter asburiae TaxID=61645 RepID=A0A376FIZ3_ENTAS|nr:acetylglutamate kinase [Enterobacter asburiae]
MRKWTAEKAEQLIAQGIITDGMIVKVNAALDAARTLGRPVDIASWRHAEQLPALFNGTPDWHAYFSVSFLLNDRRPGKRSATRQN